MLYKEVSSRGELHENYGFKANNCTLLIYVSVKQSNETQVEISVHKVRLPFM
jgi:hypothetical protein